MAPLKKQHYDIVIIGAGMVGTSLAAMLLERAGSLNLRIALLESGGIQPKAGLDAYQPSFDARATALAYGSAQIYQQLSLWDKISQRAQPITQIHVSDKGHFGATRLRAETEHVPALGYVVENKWLGEVLFEQLAQHPNAQCLSLFSEAQVQNINRKDGVSTLTVQTVKGELALSADLVVMADGGRSSLREAMGIKYTEQPYHQSALVCNVEIDRAHQNTAYERFTDTGPMALLPLKSQNKQHLCGLIWTVAEDQLDKMLALDDAAFLTALQQRFGYRLGRFISAGSRVNYPYKLQSAQEQVRPGVVIVGNAAHTLHPLAGQGFNLALRGVAALTEHLFNARANNVALSDYKMLQAYQQTRIGDQRSTLGFSDKSMKLFTSTNALLTLGRDLGLQLLDITPVAKTLFARSAMGLTSALPEFNGGEDPTNSQVGEDAK